jgi:HPt (histidine-containing phosphotransfer) domain-containing protein
MNMEIECDDPVEIDGIDSALGLRNVGGLVSLLMRVRRRFAMAYRHGLPVLLQLQGFEHEALASWSQACHSVRGALVTLGATRLADQVATLERELREPGSRATLIEQGQALHEAVLGLASRLAADADAAASIATLKASTPASRNDPARLAELRRLLTPGVRTDPVCDEITRRLASALDVPIAMVNVLEAERDRFVSSVGLNRPDGPVADSFCEAFFDTQSDLITVEDTLKDDRYIDHPYVVSLPFIRFYAASRLVVAGQLVGTLCAFDSRPKAVTGDQLRELRTMTAELTGWLESHDRVAHAPS